MLISILLGEGDLTFKLIYVGMYLIAIILSFSFHEWAHAHAAYRNGDYTARNLGRMTLNPLAHIDPLGFLMILIVGFGWAKPVPVNPNNYRKYRKGEFQVSMAGIFTNIIISLISAFIYVAVYTAEILTGTEIPEMVYTFLTIMGYLNVALAVFNFLPVFPLDGFHLFELLFGRKFPKAVLWMHNHGRIVLYIFFGLSFIMSRFGVSIVGSVAEFVFDGFIQLFWLVAKIIMNLFLI
ncbi:MAG: site-2 protease family protein [Clostridia bacterium]|nr:site-2 protease family protein [Clostridia bacterium]